MERHPDLQFVFTEQGTEWVPEELARLDMYYGRMTSRRRQPGGRVRRRAWSTSCTSSPSGYWERQCHLGSSFIRRHEVKLRDQVGIDRIMWGSDFPHLEGCWPWSRDHLQMSFGGECTPDEIQAMVGGNAARVYGFDLDALAPIADKVGPAVADLTTPLKRDDIPDEAMRCPAFAIGKFRPDPDLD